jgi:hypothetical protein
LSVELSIFGSLLLFVLVLLLGLATCHQHLHDGVEEFVGLLCVLIYVPLPVYGFHENNNVGRLFQEFCAYSGQPEVFVREISVVFWPAVEVDQTLSNL